MTDMGAIVALAAVAVVAAPFVLRIHLVASRKRLRSAGRAWDMLERPARVLLEDRHLDPEVGNLVEWIVTHIGDGRLTRSFLFSLAFRRMWAGKSMKPDVLERMNKEQEQQFLRLVVAALFYDSLRTTLSGSILRRVLYWLAATVKDRHAPVTRSQAAPVVKAADRMCHSH